METNRLKLPLFVGIIFAVWVARSFGCGPVFEEAPPTLDYYFDCLPVKSLGQIFVETSPVSTAKVPPSVPDSIKKIVSRVKIDPARKLLEEVDDLLTAVRATSGDHDDLALLHDMRDALGSAPKDCADYFRWRLDHPIKPTVKPDPYGSTSIPLPSPPSDLTETIEKKASDLGDPMRAHWLYLRGALSFNYGNKTEAQKWFDRVANEFPNHPRAEMAMFMSGRCLLAQSRETVEYNTPQEDRERIEARARAKHAEAIARFREYLKKYPNGRFVADAYGWLGALDTGVVSLDDYIRQVETPAHPEVLKSGVMMIQKRLCELESDPKDGAQAIDLVARHPKVAMSMLYLVVGTLAEERDVIPGGESPLVQIKKWRDSILPRLASSVAAQKDRYAPSDIWQPRYLSILAHAASNAGNQNDAIKLTDILPKGLEQSDDLLFVHAIALQRAGRAREAIAAFQSFLSRFPSSQLANGVRVRLGIALCDHHEAGRAVLELKKLLDQKPEASSFAGEVYPPGDARLKLTDSPIFPDISSAEGDELRQVIDTILNFAPISELSGALSEKDLDSRFADELKAIIATRALVIEDYEIARKFMAPEEFAAQAEELANLTEKSKAVGDPKEKAEIQARVGDVWAAHRGNLLNFKVLPADFRSESNLAEIKRRINGKAMGFQQVDSELDERDEMRHASRWWLRAARSNPSSKLSAACRLKTLEAMAKIASQTDYAFQRAIEERAGDASREIYNRLQAESPGSIEAKQAAFWTFFPPHRTSDYTDKLGFSDIYLTNSLHVNWRLRNSGYLWEDYQILGERVGDDDTYEGREIWHSVGDRISALRDTTRTIPELAKEVGDLRGIVSAHFTSVYQTACMNFLDDLALFLQEPHLTDDMVRRYVNLRLDVLNASSWHYAPFVPKLVGIEMNANSYEYCYADINPQIRERIAAALSDEKMKPCADYLEFLDAAMVANSQVKFAAGKTPDGTEVSYSDRDYPQLEKKMRTFMERYPLSRKREAARLLLARAVYRQSWPHIETCQPDSGEPQTISFQRETLNPQRVFSELDAYDREFSNGRYSPEIRDMRASVCWRTADWKPALDLTLRQIGEQLPDLRRDAALRLANIFAELVNPKNRPALIAAIRENPSALAWLKSFLATAPNYRAHPLRFLSGFLQDQLGFQLPAPETPEAPH